MVFLYAFVAAAGLPDEIRPDIPFVDVAQIDGVLPTVEGRQPCAEDGPTRRLSYRYDAAGRLVERSCWGCENLDKSRLDHRTVYERDSEGYLDAIQVYTSIDVFERTGPPPAPSIHEEVRFERDAAHRLTAVHLHEHHGDQHSQWRFSWKGDRLETVATRRDDAWLLHWRYSWDDGPRPHALTRFTDAGEVSSRRVFSWDEHGELSRDERRRADSSLAMVSTATRDAVGQVVARSYDYQGSSPDMTIDYVITDGRIVRETTAHGDERTVVEPDYDAEGARLSGGGLCCFPRVYTYDCDVSGDGG